MQISQVLGGRSSSSGKAVSSLVAVDDWRALFGLVDTCLTVYDIHTCRQVAQETQTRGAHLVSVHESSRRVAVATTKKRLMFFGWTGGLAQPLVPRGAIELQDVPVCLCCAAADQVVIGYPRGFVVVGSDGLASKLVDTERPVDLEQPVDAERPIDVKQQPV